jgi:RNA polymerase sigma factor (sigma-70 family)
METTIAGYSMLPETELVRKIAAGETALFEIIIRRYNGPLYKVARCYGFNHQDAEDLMQETYLSAYTHLSKFENRSLLKTWLTKILIHKCLYKLNYGVQKHEQPAATLTENSEPMLPAGKKLDTEAAVLRREFSNLLEHTLQQLPLHYKTVFVLRAIQGFSVAETAELLAISPVNVKVRFNRAKGLLHEKLEQFYSSADIFEFNLIYCDKIVANVLEKIRSSTGSH